MTWFKKLVNNNIGKILSSSILRSRILILILLFIIGAFPISSYAQENPAPWRETLNCAPENQNYTGIEYCTGLNGKAHVLIIDLHESGIGFEYVIAEGNDRDFTYGECEDVNIPQWSSGPGCYDPSNSNFYPIMSLLDAVNRHPNAAAVINTDYGATNQERGHGPEGFAVIHGNRIDGPALNDTDNNAERRPWLGISQNPPLRAEFDQYEKDEDDGSKPEWVYTGIGGAPWLIKNGQIDKDEISSCKNANSHSCSGPTAQTAIALSQDGRWLYLVVIEDTDANETAEFLHDKLQPWQAIKMDGGGSSQLWYQGSSIKDHIVFAGDGRKLSQYLAIFAEPGSGIIIEPPSDLPGRLGAIWQNIKDIIGERWERLKTGLSNWWDQTMRGLGEQIDAFFANIQRQLEEWVETQLQAFLDQLCATAILPIGGLVLWQFRRNRKTKG